MNLQMEELFNVLTQECFFAADRFKDDLGVQTHGEYDTAFKHFSTALHPVVMWDGLIPEEARKSIVRGVVERSNLTDNMHLMVDQQFVEYVKTHASETFKPVLDIFLHTFKPGNCSGRNFKHSFERFSPSLFYGEWMEEYPLQPIISTLRSMHYKTKFPAKKSEKYSVNERLNIISSQWKNTEEGAFFSNFVKEYSTHPKFSAIIEKMGYENDGIFHFSDHSFVNFQDVIGSKNQARLCEFTQEIFNHWTAFNTTRVSVLSSMLALEIQQRCVGLLKNMECDVGADLSVTVAPLEKSNVEDFRNKNGASAPPISHKI